VKNHRPRIMTDPPRGWQEVRRGRRVSPAAPSGMFSK
jgi:hypothetical protein